MAELDRRLRVAHGGWNCRAAAPPEGGGGGQAGAGSPAAAAHPEPVNPDPDRPAPAGTGGGEADPFTEFPGAGMADGPAPEDVEKLPPVEELAQQIPAEVKTVLDELFRARWTEVRRLRPEDVRK